MSSEPWTFVVAPPSTYRQMQLQRNATGEELQLILASASPRRRELLIALGATFTVITTDAEESDAPVPANVTTALPEARIPQANHPTLLAWRKATAVAVIAPEAVVIGADTIVMLDGEVLNKPVDDEHAREMLRSLAGRSHTVFTGLCVIAPQSWGSEPRQWLELVAAEVEFNAVDESEIAAYVATGEPRDKAGAYGLQGLGGRLVRSVRGSYTAVVGFPLVEVRRLLKAAGIRGLADPVATYRRWLQGQGKEPMPWPTTLP